MINSGDYNFSFSGLKTAVLYLLRDLKKKMPNRSDRGYSAEFKKELVGLIAREFQQAVVDVLVKKTIQAAKEYKAKTIILGGGVAANKELRKQMEGAIGKLNFVSLLMPEMRFTGDNAAMIALAAYFRWIKQKKPAELQALKASGNLKLV